MLENILGLHEFFRSEDNSEYTHGYIYIKTIGKIFFSQSK